MSPIATGIERRPAVMADAGRYKAHDNAVKCHDQARLSRCGMQNARLAAAQE
jgi:hypothetical protein